jgi:hypothetical protein
MSAQGSNAYPQQKPPKTSGDNPRAELWPTVKPVLANEFSFCLGALDDAVGSFALFFSFNRS